MKMKKGGGSGWGGRQESLLEGLLYAERTQARMRGPVSCASAFFLSRFSRFLRVAKTDAVFLWFSSFFVPCRPDRGPSRKDGTQQDGALRRVHRVARERGKKMRKWRCSCNVPCCLFVHHDVDDDDVFFCYCSVVCLLRHGHHAFRVQVRLRAVLEQAVDYREGSQARRRAHRHDIRGPGR